jgi:ADP-ribose pyrophosphatase YjhB (NUDIX family)
MQERRIAVRGIIFKDGKLLCQKLTAYRRDDRDFWCTPGGGLDIGEQLEDGLRREMIEETGIDPKIGRLLFMQQFSEDGKKEQMEFFFLIENPEDYMAINLEETTHGVLEIEQVEFINPKTEVVLPAFLQTIDLDHLTSVVEPVRIYNEIAPL